MHTWNRRYLGGKKENHKKIPFIFKSMFRWTYKDTSIPKISLCCRLSSVFSSPDLRHWQQDLRVLLPLLCHQVHPGGNQEGPQAAPRLHWILQMWALTLCIKHFRTIPKPQSQHTVNLHLRLQLEKRNTMENQKQEEETHSQTYLTTRLEFYLLLSCSLWIWIFLYRLCFDSAVSVCLFIADRSDIS